MIKLYNPSNDTVYIPKGKAFVQGIVLPYQICDGAESDENRTGGLGSTG
jgi:dUTPase